MAGPPSSQGPKKRTGCGCVAWVVGLGTLALMGSFIWFLGGSMWRASQLSEENCRATQERANALGAVLAPLVAGHAKGEGLAELTSADLESVQAKTRFRLTHEGDTLRGPCDGSVGSNVVDYSVCEISLHGGGNGRTLKIGIRPIPDCPDVFMPVDG